MKKILISIPLMLVVILTLAGCGKQDIKVQSLVAPSEISVFVEGEFEIDVLILPQDATNKTLEWTSEDTAIATVSQEGRVYGVSVGETTITVKVKNQAISKDIQVTVSEKHWPNDEIEEHFGFTLPQFPAYSSLQLIHLPGGGLEIVLAGYGSDHEVLDAYELLLEEEGWVKSSSSNHHVGSYTKEGISETLSYHSSASHGVETIELKIT